MEGYICSISMFIKNQDWLYPLELMVVTIPKSRVVENVCGSVFVVLSWHLIIQEPLILADVICEQPPNRIYEYVLHKLSKKPLPLQVIN